MKLKYQVTCHREISQEELETNDCVTIAQYADKIQQLINTGKLSVVEEVQDASNIDLVLVQGIEGE